MQYRRKDHVPRMQLCESYLLSMVAAMTLFSLWLASMGHGVLYLSFLEVVGDPSASLFCCFTGFEMLKGTTGYNRCFATIGRQFTYSPLGRGRESLQHTQSVNVIA